MLQYGGSTTPLTTARPRVLRQGRPGYQAAQLRQRFAPGRYLVDGPATGIRTRLRWRPRSGSTRARKPQRRDYDAIFASLYLAGALLASAEAIRAEQVTSAYIAGLRKTLMGGG